ncbi:multidrug effflux MFS transporter [Roseovarius indicus]|uniref:Bcr/CflA family efflux transporter n=1 Tax=Roseovarius indicus TaxID=540747 RepID=A0A0T5P3P1_9RHOB|nr:multidrug effflux MFS transporter [Roseovarius indicus]KRS15881.1 major facilitator transporter [Roseovarius indicus]QEW26396.1 Sulfonamide resistance protein [Roseovarius indicus]SFE63740.1 MFS transporter, DHA1 family, bicyclomycin/chloramphenicol resistance protein [Roseovarius indicus]
MLRTGLVLGLLALVGPAAIDMYLPAMPRIAEEFGTSETAVQMTLTGYFIAFGVAQLVYGPLADQAGRRLPIFLGLGIFIVGAFGSAMAGSAEALVAWRAVQGLGGAALMVVPRAIIRDQYTGVEATKLMAMIMLVIAISPMLAPLAGSGIMALSGWRAVFFVLAGLGVLSAVLTLLAQPETLPKEVRVRISVRSMLRGGRVLLFDPGFMGVTLIGGFGMASFFVFLASAPFVYVEQFGLSPTGFSVAFALNAIGFFTASQLASWLGAKMGMRRLIRRGVTGFTLFTLALVGVALTVGTTLPLVVAGLFCANACLGVVIPTSMVLALDDHGDIAGLASSMGGTLQMLAGGLMIVAAGPFFDGTALPMLAAIALCGVIATVLTVLMLPREQYA